MSRSIAAWSCIALAALVSPACEDAELRDAGAPSADVGADHAPMATPDGDTDASEPSDAAMDASLDAFEVADASDASERLDALEPRDAFEAGSDGSEADAADMTVALDSGPPTYTVGTRTEELTRRGEPGGGETAAEALCGPGSVAVGLTGTSDVVVRSLGLICASVLDDGRLGPDRETARTPAGVVADLFSDRCPAGEVLVGLHGTVSGHFGLDLLTEVGIACAPFEPWVLDADTMITTRGPLHGMPGDAPILPFEDVCSAAFVAYRLTAQVGGAMAAVGADCVIVETR